MARIFISHSSADNFEAIAFHDWLIREGWAEQDIFVDFHDLSPGERWKEALAKANERCEAVVFLASPASLASAECRLELRMAEDYGKEIIVALLPLLKLDDPALGPFRDRQIIDLCEDPRDVVLTATYQQQTKTIYFSQRTLRAVKGRLDQIGISPNAFVWRPKDIESASPYPGFESFSEGEAALFFGRSADIARGLAEVRKLRRLAMGQILLIQAASGAGKSSYLKAGLWPRLMRDPEIVTIGVVRPATGILFGEHGLGRRLSAFFAGHRVAKSASSLHREFAGDVDDVADRLVDLLNEAVGISHAISVTVRPEAPLPTPVLAVDQAEELFAAGDGEESRRFLEIIARVLDPSRLEKRPQVPRLVMPPIFIWTMRADSLNGLMHAFDTTGLKPPQPFLLPPLPREAYREIIEQPLSVANQAGMRLEIDPMLTDELVRTSTGADALPLLAFTLRQLMADSRSGSRANLTLNDYVTAGGMDGVLRKRLDAALRASGATDADLRRLMIPGLATWDEEANPPSAKRLVIAEAALLAGTRANLKSLSEALVAARLLTRSGGVDGQPVLEVAHEALLRARPISGWLLEDREFLIWLANIARARQLDEINTDELFFGGPTEDARRWLSERHEDIPQEDRSFIEGALAAEQLRREEEQRRREAELAAAREREALAQQVADEQRAAAEAAVRESFQAQRVKRRTVAAAIVSLLLAVVAAGAGGFALVQSREAEQQRATAVDQRDAAAKARDLAIESADKFLTGLTDRFRDSAVIPQAQLTQILSEGEAFLADMSAKIGDSRKLAMVESRLLLAFARISAETDLSTASRMVERAAKRQQALDAGSPEALAVLAEISVRQAELQDRRGNHEAALKSAALAAQFLNRMPDSSPSITTLAGEAVYVQAAARFELNEHAEGYELASECIRKLTPLAGDNYFLLRNLWRCHRVAAITLYKLKRYSEATMHEQAELALTNKAIGAYPVNVDARAQKVSLLVNVGYGHRDRGDYSAAIRALTEAQNEIAAALALAPWNATLIRNQARVETALAENLRKTKRYDAALSAAYLAFERMTKLFADDPSNDLNLRRLLVATDEVEEAMVEIGAKALSDAEKKRVLVVMARRIELLRQYRRPQHSNPESVITFVIALQRMADILDNLGEFSRASDLMDESANLTDAGFAMPSPDWRYRFWSHWSRQTANGCSRIKETSSLSNEAKAALMLRRIERADKYLRLEPMDWMTVSGRNWCYLQLADVYEQANQFSSAEAYYAMAAKSGYPEAIDKLEQWYEKGAASIRPDPRKAEFYRNHRRIKSPGMKRFTVPARCPSCEKPEGIHLYLINPDQIAPLEIFGSDPLEAEFYRVEIIQGMKLTEDVKESFRKLLVIANDNKVDFKDLLVYALGTASSKEEELFGKLWQDGKSFDVPNALSETRRIAKENGIEPVVKAFQLLREKGRDGLDRLVTLGPVLIGADPALAEAAMNVFLDASGLTPNEIKSALYIRARARFGQKNVNGGEVDYLQALALSGDNPVILNSLAYEWLEAGRNIVQAEALALRAVAQKPDDGNFLDTLGWARVKLGRLNDGIMDLRRSIELVTGIPDNHFHLAVALRQQGQRDNALRALQNASERDKEKTYADQIERERVLLGCGTDALPALCQ